MAKNVLHILGTAQRSGTSIARIVGALARGIDPDRYSVHACFLAGSGPLDSELRAVGAHVQCINWPSGARDPAGAWRFWRGLGRENYAIVHQHWGGRAPRWLARTLGQAKMIAHLHGHLMESKGLTPMPFRLRGVDLVIATSKAVADCVVGSRVRVVYPGVNVSNDRDGGLAAPRAAGETVLGTACRLVHLKAVVYLIRALALLHKDTSRVRLEIAGSGPELKALEHEVQLHRLANHVRFLGWQADLMPLMAGWDIYVQPSVGEPFGITALEAMAAGLPVVATADGGLPELVEHGRTGWLVPPRDSAALADRLRALLLDPEQRRRMGAAGCARARESFSVDRMVKSISNIYDEVLAERKRVVQ